MVAAISALGGRKVNHSDLANKVTNKYKRIDVNAKQVREALEALQRESPARIYSHSITTSGRAASCYTLVDLMDIEDASE